jgi:PAS domain S-box-containing protein
MSWFTGRQKKRDRIDAEAALHQRVEDSQRALIEAATMTADVAQSVTITMKRKLEDSVRLFEATVAMLSDALLICDEEGRVQAVNPAAEAMFASSAKSLIGLPVTNFIRRNSVRLPSAEILWRLLDEGSGDLTGWRINGERFLVEIDATKLDRSDGVTVTLMLVRETTAERAAMRVAAIHEQRYRTLFDMAMDGILVVQNDCIVAANPAVGHMFDREVETLIRARLEALVDGADEKRLLEAMEDTPGGEPVQVDSTRHDGTPIQLLLSSASITWDDAPACLVTVRDVTITSGSKVASADMICVFNTNFTVTYVNDAFAYYYGVTRHDMAGADLRSFLPEAERETFMLNIRALKRESPTRRMQLHTPGMDGSIRFQDWVDHAAYDADGNLREYQRTGRDTSDALQIYLSRKS